MRGEEIRNEQGKVSVFPGKAIENFVINPTLEALQDLIDHLRNLNLDEGEIGLNGAIRILNGFSVIFRRGGLLRGTETDVSLRIPIAGEVFRLETSEELIGNLKLLGDSIRKLEELWYRMMGFTGRVVERIEEGWRVSETIPRIKTLRVVGSIVGPISDLLLYLVGGRQELKKQVPNLYLAFLSYKTAEDFVLSVRENFARAEGFFEDLNAAASMLSELWESIREVFWGRNILLSIAYIAFLKRAGEVLREVLQGVKATQVVQELLLRAIAGREGYARMLVSEAMLDTRGNDGGAWRGQRDRQSEKAGRLGKLVREYSRIVGEYNDSYSNENASGVQDCNAGLYQVLDKIREISPTLARRIEPHTKIGTKRRELGGYGEIYSTADLFALAERLEKISEANDNFLNPKAGESARAFVKLVSETVVPITVAIISYSHMVDFVSISETSIRNFGPYLIELLKVIGVSNAINTLADFSPRFLEAIGQRFRTITMAEQPV